MKMPIKGIIPPLITPLLNNYTIDVNGLERLIEHIVSGGVHGLFVLGTTGEAPSLSNSLKKDIIKRTCELINHKIPVLVGITDTSFENSLEMAEYSQKVGADAVVVAAPYYIPISQSEMIAYLENLIPELALPLLLYNVPSHVKLHLEKETVTAAKDLGAIGIKDSSGDMFYLLSLIEEFKKTPEFSILTGTELFIPETIMQGGHGAVAGGANIFPKLFVSFYEASVAHDYDRISLLRNKVMMLYNTIYNVGECSSRITKGINCALSAMGICNDYVAFPLRRFEGEEKQRIEKYILELNEILI
jgi:dihydrodipicolinate synthase/N-acetylneuraminate lyase